MKLLVYTLLFAVFFSLFARLQVYINYLVNQKYYAEVLCKNKAVKNSCCQGKCAMEKELVSLDKKEEEQPAKSDSQVTRLSKAENAVCAGLKLIIDIRLLSLINTPFTATPVKGSIPVAFKPPCT